MGECINTEGAKQAVMIELELSNSLTKIINTFAQQLKKEGIPYVTNIVLALYGFF